MSHPPETSLSSRELAEQIAHLSSLYNEPFIHMVALIDAWVRVRDAALMNLIEKWRSPVASSTPQNEAVYNHCADDLESAIATARKQLEEKVK